MIYFSSKDIYYEYICVEIFDKIAVCKKQAKETSKINNKRIRIIITFFYFVNISLGANTAKHISNNNNIKPDNIWIRNPPIHQTVFFLFEFYFLINVFWFIFFRLWLFTLSHSLSLVFLALSLVHYVWPMKKYIIYFIFISV